MTVFLFKAVYITAQIWLGVVMFLYVYGCVLNIQFYITSEVFSSLHLSSSVKLSRGTTDGTPTGSQSEPAADQEWVCLLGGAEPQVAVRESLVHSLICSFILVVVFLFLMRHKHSSRVFRSISDCIRSSWLEFCLSWFFLKTVALWQDLRSFGLWCVRMPPPCMCFCTCRLL